MYKIDRIGNRISKLKPVKFSELGFTERNHLQEWLAHQPDALGEELLLIQKEFDGFDDTRERLDLLALDKHGALVVIENKLDDSGRDVVWQSLKYASYCSTLSKSQVAEIYQQFLDRSGEGGDAIADICDFLGEEDFSDVVLNPGNDQRIIMVAAQFRKEVTSTVLWLLKHKVWVKCFKATPFQDGDLLFLSVDQVIPLPEAEELMIGISEKETEEQSAERGQATKHLVRTEFWQRALESLRQAGVTLYANVGPTKDQWLYAGSGIGGIVYSIIFNRNEVRVQFMIARGSKEQNKAVFDDLAAKQLAIEARFGKPLQWRRNNDKKASVIEICQGFDAHARENWPQVTAWFDEHVKRMETAFAPEIPALRSVIQSQPTAALQAEAD